MSFVIAGVAALGTGLTIYGDINSAKDQANMDNEKAQVAMEQEQELATRNANNASLLEQTAFRQKMQFGASYAASGKAGTGVGSQLQIQNQADIQNMIGTKEANFQEQMLQQQAGVDTTLASETLSAGTINAIGAGLLGASKIAGGLNSPTPDAQSPGYGAPGQGMGAYPSLGANTNFGSTPSLGSLMGGSTTGG